MSSSAQRRQICLPGLRIARGLYQFEGRGSCTRVDMCKIQATRVCWDGGVDGVIQGIPFLFHRFSALLLSLQSSVVSGLESESLPMSL